MIKIVHNRARDSDPLAENICICHFRHFIHRHIARLICLDLIQKCFTVGDLRDACGVEIIFIGKRFINQKISVFINEMVIGISVNRLIDLPSLIKGRIDVFGKILLRIGAAAQLFADLLQISFIVEAAEHIHTGHKNNICLILLRIWIFEHLAAVFVQNSLLRLFRGHFLGAVFFNPFGFDFGGCRNACRLCLFILGFLARLLRGGILFLFFLILIVVNGIDVVLVFVRGLKDKLHLRFIR